MRICTVTLQSASGSPYSQGKHITLPEIATYKVPSTPRAEPTLPKLPL